MFKPVSGLSQDLGMLFLSRPLVFKSQDLGLLFLSRRLVFKPMLSFWTAFTSASCWLKVAAMRWLTHMAAVSAQWTCVTVAPTRTVTNDLVIGQTRGGPQHSRHGLSQNGYGGAIVNGKRAR